MSAPAVRVLPKSRQLRDTGRDGHLLVFAPLYRTPSEERRHEQFLWLRNTGANLGLQKMMRRKKNVKKGIQFCLMVCGASGTGMPTWPIEVRYLS